MFVELEEETKESKAAVKLSTLIVLGTNYERKKRDLVWEPLDGDAIIIPH